MRTEYEVLAYDDHSCSESVEQLPLHELLGGEGGKPIVESQNVNLIGTRSTKQFAAILDRCKRPRRIGWPEHGSRMWPKRDGDEG